MKKFLSILIALIICNAYSYGQTSDDIVCVFTKKENGKVFTKKDDGSRFVNFIITGLKSDEQKTVLIENVKKNDFIIDISISDEMNKNERNAFVSIKQGAKMEVLLNVLINNGINYIKLNDQISQVTDLKLKGEKKLQKMQNKTKP